MLVFNNPEYTKQRQEVTPLSLEEAKYLIESLDAILEHVISEAGEALYVTHNSLLQRFVWHYENMLHADTVKPWQCCYKNTTYDMDVKYELVNNKINGESHF